MAEPSAVGVLTAPGGPTGDDQGKGAGGTGGVGVDAPMTPVVDKGEGGLGGIVAALFSAAADGAGRVIRPEAAAIVAGSFGFPFALALLVLLFLVLQPRLDRRDPKLRDAPHTFADTLIGFEDDLR